MLGRRLPRVLLVHCRHALARARLTRIARLRRRYHTKLSEEERKDKCAPCRAALLTVTNRDSATMDEAEQALGLKASKH